MKEDDIAYLKLYHFSGKAFSDFKKEAIEILDSPAKKIILDLRNNPGGYLEVAQDIAGWFLKRGQIVAIEDFGGDMDLKVAGTKNGITVIQLDVKLDGLSMEIIKDSLDKAKTARMKILQEMVLTISEPRKSLSELAPRILKLEIAPDKIGDLIGPGGKNIQGIIAQAGGKEVISIDIEEDGTVLISSADSEAAEIAERLVKQYVEDIKVGKVYQGKVVSIQKDRNTGKEIGAIIEVLPGKTGMVHISEIVDRRIGKVSDELKIDQVVKVKVVNLDRERGRIALSIKKNRE